MIVGRNKEKVCGRDLYTENEKRRFLPHVLSRKKGFVIPTKSFVKIGITKIFCYNNKIFSSINKTFGCCSKIFG